MDISKRSMIINRVKCCALISANLYRTASCKRCEDLDSGRHDYYRLLKSLKENIILNKISPNYYTFCRLAYLC
jgi:hypothetical protein